MTKNPVVVAGVAAASKAAAAVVSLPAGLLTDRWDRRNLMVTANVVPGIVLAGLVVAMTAGVADLAMVYVAAVVISACDVAYTLALQAVFPDLVGSPERLATANGRLMAVEGAGEQLVGPAVGGFLFGLARRLPFLADAVSFFASAVLVRASVLTAPAPGRAPQVTSVAANGDSRWMRWWQDMRTGFSVFSARPPLKLLAAAMSAMTFNQSMVVAVLVIYGERSLHLSPSGYGLFLAGAALLGVVGLLFGGRAEARLGASGVVIAGSLACGLSYLGMSVANVAVVAALAFGLQELGVVTANVGSVTTRQRLIPRELYGRVGSVHRFFVVVAAPIGALTGGVVAGVWNVRGTVLVAGAAELTVVALLAPAVRRHLPGAGRTPPVAL